MSTAPYRSMGLAVSLVAFATVGALQVQPAAAQDAGFSSSAAVGQAELAGQRAGMLTLSGEIDDVLLATSQQDVVGTSSGNTVNADSADGGTINISDDALGNARGMINTTVNTGPNALVQGIMSLTVVINESP